jgi:predicted N-formylglutamate amidohydrolase
MNVTHATWLKHRFAYHFRAPVFHSNDNKIANMLINIVDQIENMAKTENDPYNSKLKVDTKILGKYFEECDELPTMTISQIRERIVDIIGKFL